MCPPMWAYCRHLANMLELVLPSAHQSPQPKRQIDRFSHFCTAHNRKSPYFTMGNHFPKIAPSHCGIWTLMQFMIPWGPSEPQPKWLLDRFCLFHTDDRRVSLYFTMGCPFPSTPKNCPFPWGIWTPSNTWFLGPPESSTQTASQSVQPFSQGSLAWQTDRQTTLQQQQQPFYGPLSGTTWVSRYQKKH